jgi:hypothetical protein
VTKKLPRVGPTNIVPLLVIPPQKGRYWRRAIFGNTNVDAPINARNQAGVDDVTRKVGDIPFPRPSKIIATIANNECGSIKLSAYHGGGRERALVPCDSPKRQNSSSSWQMRSPAVIPIRPTAITVKERHKRGRIPSSEY